MRHIAADGKVFVNSDSFLPATLVGHKVDCYAEDPQSAPKAVADGGLGSKLGQGLVQPPTTHTATPPPPPFTAATATATATATTSGGACAI